MRHTSIGQGNPRPAPTRNGHKGGYAVLPPGMRGVDGHGDEAGADARQERDDEVGRTGRVDEQHAVPPGQGGEVLREGYEGLLGIDLRPPGREEPRGEILHGEVQLLVRGGGGGGGRIVPIRSEKGECVLVGSDVGVVLEALEGRVPRVGRPRRKLSVVLFGDALYVNRRVGLGPLLDLHLLLAVGPLP